MQKILVPTFVILAATLVTFVSSFGQEPPKDSADVLELRSMADEEGGGIQPKFFVVRSFFSGCTHLHNMGGRWLEFNLLRKIGIEPGSKAEERLLRACSSAREISAPVFPAAEHQDNDDYQDRQWAHLRTKIQGIAFLYRDLLIDLEILGIAPEAVEQHLIEDIAPGTSTLSTESEDTIDFLVRVIEEFDHSFNVRGGE